MSIEIPMRREGAHLVPADQVAAEMLAEVPLNTGVMVTVKVPRNLRQFRLAWALADIVSKSCDWLTDRESAMDWLKIKARHVRMIHDPLRNVTAIVPKSISFASLDQAGFARVLNRMIYVTTTEIIPGLEKSSLLAELESIVGIDTVPADAPAAAKPPRATLARKTAQTDPPEAAETPSNRKEVTEAPPESTASNTGPTPAARPSPTNEAEYLASARKWISQQSNHQLAIEYLDSDVQVTLRATCKLSVGANKMVRRELAEHFEKLKGKTDVRDQATA